jgi:uncharacterized protein YndB with AHSA1/START domain
MMRRVIARDKRILSHPPERVYKALIDLEQYGTWWPRPFAFRVIGPLPIQIGTRVQVSNGALVSWTATITALEPSRRVTMRYSEGAWSGDTAWSLERTNLNATRLIYEIDLEPQDWLRALNAVVNLSSLHSRQMDGVFTALQTRLNLERET